MFETVERFDFRRVRRFEFGEHLFESRDISEPPVSVTCGDWQEFAGRDFSGDAVYGFDFGRPDTDGGSLTIDLGTVNYSCELFLNGKSRGIRCMPPYRYTVPSADLETVNHVLLRVSNTPANQYVYTHAFDNYSEGEKGPYQKRELEFEKESLVSGLLGPVRLLI